jgi:cardiolipin synthase
MSAEIFGGSATWLPSGGEAIAAMFVAIDGARFSVRLEVYIFTAGPLGERFRAALLEARKRGAQVRVLLDALGSNGLPDTFWVPLVSAGGEVRQFNPLPHQLGIRNHRKMLVCDDHIAIVGGFNIAPEYDGDGVNSGWYDLGLKLEGPLARDLAAAFDEMFASSPLRLKHFLRLRKAGGTKLTLAHEQLLLSAPGRGSNSLKLALRHDLAQARDVCIVVAYFLPTWRIRRDLARVVRRGGRVKLMLPAKSDVAVALLAGQSLYRRLLKAGVQIHEYQPQVLHAKLIVIDDIVYAGSANLDQRSLNLNYELMIRFENAELARQAREFFTRGLSHCRELTFDKWRRSHTLWQRIKQRWAYLLLVRIDPYVARWQWKRFPD